nr:polyprotein 2 [Patatavirales sp.]
MKNFNNVGSVEKFPVMRNKRKRDPIITQALAMHDPPLEIETGHGLPRMNLDASYRSLNKYAKEEKPYDENAAVFASQALEMEFLPYMGKSHVRDLEEGHKDVDLTTSPGFPWNLKYKTKKDLYESTDYPLFLLYCEKDWERMLHPNTWYIFSNSLKEEVRADEKIQANKIRTFTASPAEAVVTGNRLFGEMNEKFIESHLKTASVVGMNPFKGGWDQAYRKLKNHPKRGMSKIWGFEMDESEYDSSMRSFLFDAIVAFRIKCLCVEDRTPENVARIKNYYRNIVNSVIITADGKIVQKHLGNPSGSVNTISDNTLILYFLLAYAWYILAEDEKRTIEEFRCSVVELLQGDDNTWSVDEVTMAFYNAKSVSNVFSEIGITTTSPCYDPREIEELSFLSSSFSCFINHVCVYNLDTDKILESLKWTEYPGNPVRTLERVAACLLNTWPNNEARWLCRTLAKLIIDEFDPVLHSEKDWVDQKSKLWTDTMFLFFYVGDASALNNISHIKDFGMESIIAHDDDFSSCYKYVIANGFFNLQKAKNKNKNNKKQKKKQKRKNNKRQNKKKNNYKKKKFRGAGSMGPRVCETMVPVGIATSGISRAGTTTRGSKKGRDAVYITGHERLGSVTLAAPLTEGQVILNQLVSPELIGKRLKGFSKLYDRYCFDKMHFKYVPLISAANPNANGGIVMAIDYDPADSTPIPSKDGLNSVFSSEFAQENAVYSEGEMNAKRINPRKDYYIDNNGLDVRWSKQARFYVFSSGALAAGTYGDIIFEYGCHLYSPQNEPSADEMGGFIAGGGTLALANILGDVPVVDAEAENISVTTGGVITFSAAGNVLATVTAQGTTLGALGTPAGWTINANITNPAQTVSLMTMRKYVSAGETLGPLTIASFATLTGAGTRMAVAPYNSLNLSEAQQKKIDEETEYERLLRRLAFIESKFDSKDLGFVKLPRLSKSKKVVEDDSEEERVRYGS